MRILQIGIVAVLLSSAFASPQLGTQFPLKPNPLDGASTHQPFEYGVVFQGGNGLTDNRGGFHFLQAGVHAGRVLTNNFGSGIFRGNFEYAMELFPYWEAFTPVFQRVSCTQAPVTNVVSCSQPYNVGGTFHGVTFTPIILRWNFARHGKFTPWAQAAGGLLYTTHKFPSYGNTDVLNFTENGPNGETSVWNFTPQGGVGFHYFTRPNRSIDFSANGEHISSASLGDRNPGVNASVQFTVGYTWWK
jgi:lipid A 3-O-deacylase